MNVYHFTSSAHLPWIIGSRELRPGSNRIGGFPDPDFLWATTSPEIDWTASGASQQAYRDGSTLIVRIKLGVADFFPWSEVRARHPEWTDAHVKALEDVGRKRRSNAADWFCRAGTVPIEAFVEVDAKAYSWGSWKPVEPVDARVVGVSGRSGLAMNICGKTYASIKTTGPHGQDAYAIADVIAARPEEA